MIGEFSFRRLASFCSDDWRVFVPTIGEFLLRLLVMADYTDKLIGLALKENNLER